MSRTQLRHVSHDECEQMRELYDEGVPQYRISEAFDRSVGAVRRHVKDSCQHQTGGRRETPGRDAIIDALETLAAEIERIPSGTDWDSWGDRPCDSKTVRNEFGSAWGDVLQATDFPDLPERAPKSIRSAAYQRPELCSYDD